MATAHFVDVHVLGEPQAVREALAAVRAMAIKTRMIDEKSGDVAKNADKPLPSVAPWPLGQHHACMGMVFDDNGFSVPSKRIRNVLLSTALAHQGVSLAAAAHWSLDHDAVRLWAASDRKPGVFHAAAIEGAALEKSLGMPLYDAMCDDTLLDQIGCRLMPALVLAPRIQGCFAPFVACQRAKSLEKQLLARGQRAARQRM